MCIYCNFSSVIGLPPEDQWPDVSLPWGSFAQTAPRPLDNFIPEICPEGLALLQVYMIRSLDLAIPYSFNKMKEPSKANLAQVGFEPTTSGLQVQC